MRIYFKSICKCFGIFNHEEKQTNETFHKDDDLEVQKDDKKEIVEESVFRIKETRQRSVDYVMHSPRFGNPNLPDCTGGTDNSPI